MNKLTRNLMSGASLAALSVGGISVGLIGEADANIIINTTTPGSVTATLASFNSYISVTTFGDVNGNLVNDGVVGVPTISPVGIGVFGSGTVEGSIINNGIDLASDVGIYVNSSAFVSSDIVNSKHAVIAVVNDSVTFGTPVAGIWDNGGLDGGITNSGEIHVVANGSSGSAGGVVQLNDHAGFHNSGSVIVEGNGNGLNLDYYGVWQDVIGGNAYANVTNDANATIEVYVSLADASVAAHAAIMQTVDATSGTAIANVDNSGLIEIKAFAHNLASAITSSDVARVRTGIYQFASATNTGPLSSGNVDISLTNNSNGTILVSANADAVGSRRAWAYATVGDGIIQIGSISQAGPVGNMEGDVSIDLVNNGAITVEARATASATGASAFHASARAMIGSGIDQHGIAGDHTDITLNNQSNGDIQIHAFATANASSGRASASALIFDEGIRQVASAGGDEDGASVAITNAGILDIGATAYAHGRSTATAKAYIERGIEQTVKYGAQAAASLANSGDLEILAFASATASSGFASAKATIGGSGIRQYVNASGTHPDIGTTDVTIASANLTSSSGSLIIGAIALADGDSAHAFADLASYGIDQVVLGADQVSATIANNGKMVIGASAGASATSFNATAHAIVATGIHQVATAYGNHSAAAVHLTNSSSGTLTIGAHAVAYGNTHALASASITNNGIFQQANVGNDAAASINNSGNLTIGASALAQAFGSATAHAFVDPGIFQSVSADGGKDGTASIDNSGSGNLNIGAIATAESFLANAYAAATMDTGIEQKVWRAKNADDSLTNGLGGKIIIGASAKATASNFASAYAVIDKGIYQFVSSTSPHQSASALIDNSGELEVISHAIATGGSAGAHAQLKFGISQDAYYGGVSDALTNSGLLGVTAEATASATATKAYAWAEMGTGVRQYANGEGYGDASVSLTNTGELDVLAIANARGNGSNPLASAYATIDTRGIAQIATDGSVDTTVSLTNDGPLTIKAHAVATASNTAYAVASVQTGIYQSAYGSNTTGSIASAGLDNQSDGVLAIIAQATANADSGANATAIANIEEFAILQKAENAESASVSLTNAGTIDIAAIAVATDPAASASAHAYIHQGISQYASVTGSHLSASAALTNSTGASLHVSASAHAIGTTHAIAKATLSYGISQYAYYGDTSKVSLTNNGTIDIVGHAIATATTSHGYAQAIVDMETGIYQYASPSAGAAATASIANAGELKIEGIALAKGGKSALATVTLDTGISQYAESAKDATVTLSNSGSGTLTIAAIASATAGTNYAYATASISYTGIYQEADASAVNGSNASATLTNDGTIDIRAQAHALGTISAYGTASARIDEYGIYQTALDADTVSVGLTSNGTLGIVAKATADMNDFAKAYAYVDHGIYQNAVAANNDISASALLENGGDLTVLAAAKASGSAAQATAQNSYPIRQYAYYGDASVTLTNTGSMDIAAMATANATALGAYAYAEIDTGIYQYASAYGSGDATVTLSSKDLTILAQAKADGATKATAYAYIDSYGVYQSAYEGDLNSSVSLANSGAMAIEAHAVATADTKAYAYASVSYGIYQYAYGSAATSSTGTVSLTNTDTGTLSVIAKATANIAGTGGNTASAYAYIDQYGIYQQVEYVDSASIALSNAGTINIDAVAKATDPANYAKAFAYINYGVSQYASVTGSAVSANVSLTNSTDATLSIMASAQAVGKTKAYAAATLNYGITQHAYYGDDSTVSLTNNGTLDIIGKAVATGTSAKSYGHAVVDMETGIYQYASPNAGATASATLDNGGELKIEGIALAKAGGTAYANVTLHTGISQYAESAKDATVTLTNSENGSLTIAAIASATAGTNYAQAYASISYNGIYQEADASTVNGSSATVDLTNDGTIDIRAQAHAKGTNSAYGTAKATIDEYGIYQSALGAETASVSLTGTGDLSIVARATAVMNNEASAYAYINHGIYQDAVAANNYVSASALIDNNGGNLTILAAAKATGSTGHASAYNSYPIEQYAYYGNASATLTNEGKLDIAAMATANATNLRAYAYAEIDTGIYQYVSADGYGDASASISNSNELSIIASGNALGGTKATAYAYIDTYGVYQYADDGDLNTSVSLTNSGDMTIAALAKATADTKALAYASISTGIHQYALGSNTTGSIAGVSLTNTDTGTLSIIAQATANADGGTAATASAYIDEYGIYQYAYYAETATASLSNAGKINIDVLAQATDPANFAKAYAYLDHGIYQYAYVTGASVLASASLSNATGASLGIVASAHAVGKTQAYATATLSYGISQYAYYGDKSIASIVNNGTLDITGKAVATGTSAKSYGHAVVDMETGIYQYASPYGGASATASIDNGGALKIEGVALAKAGATALATVTLDTGISQYAESAKDATVTLTNSENGTLTIAAIASATAGTNYAQAYASISYTGIYQEADASGANGSSATVDLTNDGTIDIRAQAHAKGTNSAYGTAKATIDEYGIYQSALGADTASVSLTNTGSLGIEAMATADMNDFAKAYAYLDVGIYQYAWATNNFVSASDTLTNGPSATLNILAAAKATGSSAQASASIDYAISQLAYYGDASATLTNQGKLDIGVVANAHATDNKAYAYAEIDSGIYQYVSADGYGDATASISNSSELKVIAQASAQGGSKATASAYIDSYGAYQSVLYGNLDSSITLTNSGAMTIAALAKATADTKAVAFASVSYGIYQYVYGSNTAGSSGSISLANNEGGTLSIIAQATANADGGTAATASAFIEEYGIYQDAENVDSASVSLINDGTLDIEALAKATDPATYAKAYAYLDVGIYQSAFATSNYVLASATLSNGTSATLNVMAAAKAIAEKTAVATASISYAISQYAYYGDETLASLTNHGSLNLVAMATATATKTTGNAYAYADMVTGIYQVASADGGSAATAAVDNTAAIDIAVLANAKGGTQATASAFMEWGISQNASSGIDTEAHLTNSNDGTIAIEAIANASAVNGTATAKAGITETGIVQNASGEYNAETAIASLSNDNGSTLQILAAASAKADKFALATASVAVGIDQDATASTTGALVSSATLTNGGTLDINAHAKAHGSAASATAHINTAITQEATNGVATVSLDNSGVVDAFALATATATAGQAVAHADMAYGIWQDASGTTANASFTNQSAASIGIGAIAKANGKSLATASATLSNSQIYQGASGEFASASLINNGNLTIEALATATAATGAAYAFAGFANTTTTAGYAIQQVVSASGTGSAVLTNNADGTLAVVAFAKAKGVSKATATASYSSKVIEQEAFGGSNESASLVNDGNLTVAAMADASAVTFASANAFNGHAIVQEVSATGTSASASLTNNNYLAVGASANAHASGPAAASAAVGTGIWQSAYGSGSRIHEAAVNLTNNDTLLVSARALADGYVGTTTTSYPNYASATASINQGIHQSAGDADYAYVDLYNSGTIDVRAAATASANFTAVANAGITTGIYQSAYGSGGASANDLFVNYSSGYVHVGATAHASAGDLALAGAFVGNGVYQQAEFAGFAGNSFYNDGVMVVEANASAWDASAVALVGATTHLSTCVQVNGGPASCPTHIVQNNSASLAVPFMASATGAAIHQYASSAESASNYLNNDGEILVSARAKASGTTAAASALAIGIMQTAKNATFATDGVTNNATIDVGAAASATGLGAGALAGAIGALQSADGTTNDVYFVNNQDAVFHVHATADASGALGIASAEALGVGQFLPNGGSEHFSNVGYFHVEANADANVSTGAAAAVAGGAVVEIESDGNVDIQNYSGAGFYVSARAHGPSGLASAYGVSVVDSATGDAVNGFIDNDGTFEVVASAPTLAFAQGIGVRADQFNGTIENEGYLGVAAIGAGVTNEDAVGIAITSYDTPTGSGTATITNDGGTMWVGVSSDGVTFTRGDAIYTVNAPNAVNINLMGDGSIYGDIEMSSDDTVTISNGHTKFDGVINDPNWVGSLTIAANGTLELANGSHQYNSNEDAAHGYVDNFDQEGTLQLDINPNPRADGDYARATSTAGFISANNAHVAGDVYLNLAYGLYGDSTLYQVVFSEDQPITGTWSAITMNWNSVLLKPVANYTTYEYDIYLNRVPFGAVDGLTPNEKGVGNGLEGGYDPSLTGDFKNLYEALFTLDASQYPKVLDMLSDEEAGELALANLNASKMLLDAVNQHLNIGSVSNGMASLPQSVSRAQGGTSDTEVWGGLYGSWTDGNDTISGPGWSGTEKGVLAGVDANVQRNASLGIAASYTSDGKVDFNPFGKPVPVSHGKYDGFQIAGYGHYDADEGYYLQGFASYGDFNNDTRRYVSLPFPFGSGIVRGSYNSNVWSVYGEGGMKWSTGGDLDLTPYLGLGYMQSSSGSYTERGLGGANLAVSDAKATSFASYLGLKLDFNTNVANGRLVPTLRAAWRHEFDDKMWSVNASFAGLPGSGFSIDGSALSQDSADVSAGLGYVFDNDISAMLDYEGNFSSDRTSNTVMGRVKVKL